MILSEEKIKDLYVNQRQSCADIAKVFCCSETKIYNKLKQSEVTIRGRSEANQIFPDSIFVILYNLGLSASQVAKMLGVHSSTVVKRFHHLGFPLRSRSVAFAIRYTNEEFQQYFMIPDILNCLLKICGGDNGQSNG